jgi:hypothetical protein
MGYSFASNFLVLRHVIVHYYLPTIFSNIIANLVSEINILLIAMKIQFNNNYSATQVQTVHNFTTVILSDLVLLVNQL